MRNNSALAILAAIALPALLHLGCAKEPGGPGTPVHHKNLGDQYLEAGDMEKAVEEFAAAVKLEPHYSQAHLRMGDAYLLAGEYEKARRSYALAATCFGKSFGLADATGAKRPQDLNSLDTEALLVMVIECTSSGRKVWLEPFRRLFRLELLHGGKNEDLNRFHNRTGRIMDLLAALDDHARLQGAMPSYSKYVEGILAFEDEEWAKAAECFGEALDLDTGTDAAAKQELLALIAASRKRGG